VQPSAGDVERVDLEGLVLCPGFVDIHTHYDAQVLWDADLTPSSWHGVTTVVVGNCGIGLAPTRPEHRELITKSLVNVEGMAEDSLRAGIDWCFETFPEYVDALRDRQPRLHVELLLGHSPLRVYVMGGAAFERAATDEEVGAMAVLAAEAARAGAIGVGSSRSPNHLADDGRPLPSRLASIDELTQIARAMAGARTARPVVEIASGSVKPEELATLADRSGATVTSTAILAGRPVRGRTSIEQLDDFQAAGPHLFPQITCLPVRIQFTLENPPSAFSKFPSFIEILALPRQARAAAYQRDEWIERAAAEIGKDWDPLWSRTFLVEPGADGTETWGASVSELAAAAGTSPLRTLVDISVAADLDARFDVVVANDDLDDLAQLLLDPRALLGLSDAGAHATQLCDAGYATHLLGYWWRETGTLSLEHAVWRLTGQPATLFGLADRGCIREGARADLVAFNPTTIGSSELRRVRDQPAGGDRLVSNGIGVEHVWVAGTPIRRDGRDLDARPGRVASA
jgi:N-acyl-D-aspartate/D-glutamate deacylase